MELSWSYIDLMRRMVSSSAYRRADTLSTTNYYPVALHFDINPTGCEVPVYCAPRIEQIILDAPETGGEIVVPLALDGYVKTCSGADTIIRHFSRFYAGGTRLARTQTPKGEVYYGANGLILDKNFNPLMLATVKAMRSTEPTFPGADDYLLYNGIIVYLHPNVFLDDTAVLNKSLAKKGMQFLLSQDVSGFNTSQNGNRVKVVIEDCSKFFTKCTKPDINNFGSDQINELLKANIDEVLEQFVHDTVDYRRR